MDKTNLPSYVLPEDKFNCLKKRYDLTIKDPSVNLDERIIPLVNTIGSMKGIVPVWSCSGHTLQEQLHNTEQTTEPKNESGQVIFAVSEQGLNSLALIQRFIALEVSQRVWQALRPSLTLGRLIWCWDVDSDVPGQWLSETELNNAGTYPIWEINYLDSLTGDLHTTQEAFHLELVDYLALSQGSIYIE